MNASKLRELRKQRDISVADLARAANVSRAHMSNVLHGRRNLSDAALDGAARALGVNACDLLTTP